MSKGTHARRVIDIIDSRSYEASYTAGYSDAEAKEYDEDHRAYQIDYQRKIKERKRSKIQEKRRRLYFLKQKVIGVFFLIFTIFAVKLLDGDATIALLTIPIGLKLIFSKEKWWMDNYYFETERNERGRR